MKSTIQTVEVIPGPSHKQTLSTIYTYLINKHKKDKKTA